MTLSLEVLGESRSWENDYDDEPASGFLGGEPRLSLKVDPDIRPDQQEIPRAIELVAKRVVWVMKATSRGGVNTPPQPERLVVERAVEIMINLLIGPSGLRDDERMVPDIVPAFDGGLQLEWHFAAVDIEINLSSLGEAYADVTDVDGNVLFEGELDDVVDRIRHELISAIDGQ